MNPPFYPYSPSVEAPQPNEEQTFAEIANTMRRIAEVIGDRARHTARPVHAKSHGLLRADLTVSSNLPEHLSQGLFSKAATYPAIMRFSTNPGDMLPDSISTPRGLAVKVLGVEGQMIAGHEGNVTQDFVFVNGKAFPNRNAEAFLKDLKFLEQHVTDSQTLKQIVSTTARLAEETLEALGSSNAALIGFGHPETHILGEAFTSVAPLRYGKYVAKIAFVPSSNNLKELTNKALDHSSDYSAIRDALVKFFEMETAIWDVQVQLMTDPEVTPVEDASVQWPETASPYVTVGQLTAAPQQAYSPQRRVFVDEILAFSPWQGLEDHRPLGNIMRARKQAYIMASRLRHSDNARPLVEPRKISELPD